MKKTILATLCFVLLSTFLISCEKEQPVVEDPSSGTATVTGKVTDAQGLALSGIKIVLEHSVWAATYAFATTDANGNYMATLPSQPAGSWTAKAQLTKSAYGVEYKFDLAVDNSAPFKAGEKTVRNFTWKLSGEKENGTGYYGAHVDIYQWGTDVPMEDVTLVFTPFDAASRLADGSAIQPFERKVENVAGTYMVKDVPIGNYSVKAVYPGKVLLLKNRHLEEQPEKHKQVIFGKNGYLSETEYNIEFWISE